MRIINEPTAAAIAYGLDQKDRGSVKERTVGPTQSKDTSLTLSQLHCDVQCIAEPLGCLCWHECCLCVS